MTIQSIVFRRAKDGEWEEGILINEGDGPVLDLEGNAATEVWDYKFTPHLRVELIPSLLPKKKRPRRR